jgi:hypothetical protein
MSTDDKDEPVINKRRKMKKKNIKNIKINNIIYK